ncbi:hypothetical protein SAMN05216349_12021 [Oribacterium sp. KHPX15]|nr:hypothetical protein SAMN05216349_12021 [Oribacterium sp. KHPX15]
MSTILKKSALNTIGFAICCLLISLIFYHNVAWVRFLLCNAVYFMINCVMYWFSYKNRKKRKRAARAKRITNTED